MNNIPFINPDEQVEAVGYIATIMNVMGDNYAVYIYDKLEPHRSPACVMMESTRQQNAYLEFLKQSVAWIGRHATRKRRTAVREWEERKRREALERAFRGPFR